MRTTTDPLALPPVPPPAPANHPFRDRLAAVLFALAVALPGLALYVTFSATVTKFENRPMAPWPSLAPLQPSSTFTRDFELAFADRFGLRDPLVRLHRTTLLRGFGVSGLATVLPARDGWYYWMGEDAKALDRHYRGTLDFPQALVDATAGEFIRRGDWLAARGIAYVVVVVPEKYTIYPEFLPRWVQAGRLSTPYDRVATALKGAPNVSFVDLRPALRAEKDSRRLYYKTDSHWNYNGAMVGYGELMRRVQGLLPPGALATIAAPQVPAYVAGVDYFHGDLGSMLGLPSMVREEDVAPLAKVLGDPGGRCARRDSTALDPLLYPPREDPQVYSCAKPPGLPRAVVLRDSMAIPLIPLLAENFSRVVFMSSRRLDRALIELEQPAVVIDELVERALNETGTAPMQQ